MPRSDCLPILVPRLFFEFVPQFQSSGWRFDDWSRTTLKTSARVLLEDNTLRKQAKEATDQRELLVRRALETLTTRMDAIGVSCLGASKGGHICAKY